MGLLNGTQETLKLSAIAESQEKTFYRKTDDNHVDEDDAKVGNSAAIAPAFSGTRMLTENQLSTSTNLHKKENPNEKQMLLKNKITYNEKTITKNSA